MDEPHDVGVRGSSFVSLDVADGVADARVLAEAVVDASGERENDAEPLARPLRAGDRVVDALPEADTCVLLDGETRGVELAGPVAFAVTEERAERDADAVPLDDALSLTEPRDAETEGEPDGAVLPAPEGVAAAAVAVPSREADGSPDSLGDSTPLADTPDDRDAEAELLARALAEALAVAAGERLRLAPAVDDAVALADGDSRGAAEPETRTLPVRLGGALAAADALAEGDASADRDAAGERVELSDGVCVGERLGDAESEGDDDPDVDAREVGDAAGVCEDAVEADCVSAAAPDLEGDGDSLRVEEGVRNDRGVGVDTIDARGVKLVHAEPELVPLTLSRALALDTAVCDAVALDDPVSLELADIAAEPLGGGDAPGLELDEREGSALADPRGEGVAPTVPEDDAVAKRGVGDENSEAASLRDPNVDRDADAVTDGDGESV